MALPGLDFEETVNLKPEEIIPDFHDLPPGSEWRFEISFEQPVRIRLIQGMAEMFGTEIPINQTQTLQGVKGAIYTWQGCKLEVNGRCHSDYMAEETPMTSYLNLHAALDDLRMSARQSNTLGPRVLIAGPSNAGKTSLAKTLSAYAMRMDRKPAILNVDPREGLLSIPGTLTAASLDSILDIEDGWGSSPTNGPLHIPPKLPLTYFLGAPDAEEKPEIYKALVRRLALSTMERLDAHPLEKYTGCIIDTPGTISQGKNNYDLLQHVITEFQVNVLVVIGSERLHSDMQRRFARAPASAGGTTGSVTVLKLDKSGGCVDCDTTFMETFQKAQLRKYFYGDPKNMLSPHSQLVNFDDVKIVGTVSPEDAINISLLPGVSAFDAQELASATRSDSSLYQNIEPNGLLTNSVLAITYAQTSDPPEIIRDSAVRGFVIITEVDESKRRMRVLGPVNERLTGGVWVKGSWPEGGGLEL